MAVVRACSSVRLSPACHRLPTVTPRKPSAKYFAVLVRIGEGPDSQARILPSGDAAVLLNGSDRDQAAILVKVDG